jgi:glycosyltransferase involved in cell wall biosynthesis
MRNDRDQNGGEGPGKPLISIVLPAFNEASVIEKNLESLYQYMEGLTDLYDWELVIINDGSTDSTGDLAECFAEKKENVIVYHHPYNFRLGQALKYAFNNCQGDYIVVMDIDLSYAPEHIGEMLKKLRETRAKIVIASPYAKGGKVSHVPRLRHFLSVWANRFLCFLATRDWFSDKLTNITGMVRAYDAEFLRRLDLRAMDVDINPEIIYKAKILRARIVEIPAHLNWEPRKLSHSQIARRKSSVRMTQSIVQNFLSGFILRPFLFFIFPGGILLFASLYPLGWTVVHTVDEYRYLAHAGLSFDYRLSAAVGAAFRLSPHAFIVGGVALMVAIQLISIGFLAYQKKRYFDELYHLGSVIYRDSRIRKGDKKRFPIDREGS